MFHDMGYNVSYKTYKQVTLIENYEIVDIHIIINNMLVV